MLILPRWNYPILTVTFQITQFVSITTFIQIIIFKMVTSCFVKRHLNVFASIKNYIKPTLNGWQNSFTNMYLSLSSMIILTKYNTTKQRNNQSVNGPCCHQHGQIICEIHPQVVVFHPPPHLFETSFVIG